MYRLNAGSEKDLRVFSWAKRMGYPTPFFSLLIEVFLKKLAVGKEERRITSTLGERSTTESCMLRSGRMNRS